jgi:hypothetical protein
MWTEFSCSEQGQMAKFYEHVCDISDSKKERILWLNK